MADQLPSGRWRGRVRHPITGKQVTPAGVIGGPKTFVTRREAERAEDTARDALVDAAVRGRTVREFWTDWTTSGCGRAPRSRRTATTPSGRRRSSRCSASGRSRRSAAPTSPPTSRAASDRGTVPALRAMFNDARSVLAGQLVDRNPFANLGLRQTRGRKDVQPPDQASTARMLAAGDELTPPSFAAYLVTAVYSAARPGELDALRWDDVDLERETIRVERQWNAKLGKITPPKHGSRRTIALTAPVRERLEQLPRDSEWLFTTVRGTHYTPSSRCFHWNRVRATSASPTFAVRRDAALLRLVRDERARAAASRHRATARPRRRRRARAPTLRSPGRRDRAGAHPAGVPRCRPGRRAESRRESRRGRDRPPEAEHPLSPRCDESPASRGFCRLEYEAVTQLNGDDRAPPSRRRAPPASARARVSCRPLGRARPRARRGADRRRQQVGRPVGDGDHPPATRPRRAPINSGVEDAEVALDGRGRWAICNWMLRPRGLSMEHPRAEARSPRLKPRAPDWLLPGDLPEGPDARACASSVVTYRPTGGEFDWTDAHRTSVPPSVSPSASGLILLARRDYATALSVTATSRSRARIGGDVAPHGSRWAAG